MAAMTSASFAKLLEPHLTMQFGTSYNKTIFVEPDEMQALFDLSDEAKGE